MYVVFNFIIYNLQIWLIVKAASNKNYILLLIIRMYTFNYF